MKTFLPYLVIGIANGSIYGIAAMGLVLTYKTSGIFNFAHGGVGTAAAYVFFELRSQHGVPWPVAMALVLLVGAPLIGIGLERLARELAHVASEMKIVATVGLLITIQAAAVLRYGPLTRGFAAFLPTRTVQVAGVYVGWDQIIVSALALASAVALYAFFRSRRLGIAMRGVVDDPALLGLSGTSAVTVRRYSWVIGSVFASLSGILLAPTLGLDATMLTLLVVQAFGAAAVGWFSSLPLTYVGGLVVGVGAAVATKYAHDSQAVQGLPDSFPFVVLFAVLLFAPKGRLVEAGGDLVARAREVRLPSLRVRAGGGSALLALLLLVPFLVGTRVSTYTLGLIYVVLFLSLGLLVRTSGQVSLCHAGFAAIGASTFAHLSHDVGLPWPLAVVGAGLVCVPVGALIAIPAIRLSRLYVALATLGFGILLQRMIYTDGIMFGRHDLLIAPRPSIAGSDRAYYYVVLGVAVLACVLVVVILRSRLGRLLRGLADSPVALSVHGTNVDVTRVLVFCISAFLAAVAGAMIGPLSGSINGVPFQALTSLTLLVVLAIAGPGNLSAAFVAAAAYIVVPSYIDNPTFSQWLQLVFGASALGIAIASGRAKRARAERLGATRLTVDRTRSPVADRLVPAGLTRVPPAAPAVADDWIPA